MNENREPGIIRAAGGIVCREEGGKALIALVHRQKYDDWSLPKGKLKNQETWVSGAVREVEEETQCAVVIDDFAGCCCYLVLDTPKVVLFWLMKVESVSPFTPNEEIDQLIWVPADQALNILCYDCERDLVNKNCVSS